MDKRILMIVGMILVNTLVVQVNTRNILAEDTATQNWESFSLTESNKNEPIYHTPARIPVEGKWPFPTYANTKTYLTGDIKNGLKITLIDENKNGKYDDIGTDLIIFGNNGFGIPLSKIINIDNKLYDFKVDKTQRKVSLKPYEGKTGLVDLVSGYNSSSPLDLAILTSGNGDYFDVSKGKSFALPCGQYSLWVAYIKDKDDKNDALRVEIKGDKMEKIEIKEGDKNTTVVKWGNPLKIDFQCVIKEKKVLIPFKSIKVFGSANEEYVSYWRMAEVEIKDVNGAVVNKSGFLPT